MKRLAVAIFVAAILILGLYFGGFDALLAIAGYNIVIFDLEDTYVNADATLTHTNSADCDDSGVTHLPKLPGTRTKFEWFVPDNVCVKSIFWNSDTTTTQTVNINQVNVNGFTVRKDGTVLSHICTAGELSCIGSVASLCGDDLVSFVPIETCQYGCENGYCKAAPEPEPQEPAESFWLPALAVVVIIGLVVAWIKLK